MFYLCRSDSNYCDRIRTEQISNSYNKAVLLVKNDLTPTLFPLREHRFRPKGECCSLHKINMMGTALSIKANGPLEAEKLIVQKAVTSGQHFVTPVTSRIHLMWCPYPYNSLFEGELTMDALDGILVDIKSLITVHLCI